MSISKSICPGLPIGCWLISRWIVSNMGILLMAQRGYMYIYIGNRGCAQLGRRVATPFSRVAQIYISLWAASTNRPAVQRLYLVFAVHGYYSILGIKRFTCNEKYTFPIYILLICIITIFFFSSISLFTNLPARYNQYFISWFFIVSCIFII